ncbi:MAG: DUF3021 family protein [Saccharofermentans sp.]|nr:DUF3021 family protein [Saccharofermentans sp.]
MGKLRILSIQTFVIAFFMVVIIGLEGLIAYLAGDVIGFSWYMPLSVVIVAILTAIPSLLLIKDGEGYFSIPRIVLHGICCYVMVMAAGYVFKWYTSLRYFIYTSVMFIIVYVLVWVVTKLLFRAEDKRINSVLEKIRDEE